MTDKPVKVEVLRQGKLLYEHFAHPAMGFMRIYPAGFELVTMDGETVTLPNECECDEIRVEW